jgi:hypothetical protein
MSNILGDFYQFSGKKWRFLPYFGKQRFYHILAKTAIFFTNFSKNGGFQQIPL